MTCINPLYLVRPEYADLNIRVRYDQTDDYCVKNIKHAPHEFRVKHPELFMQIPCGKCFACKTAITREWSIRLIHEMRSWNQCVFATFTYDDAYLPTVIHDGKRVGTLLKSDLQLLFKRLRKAIDPYSLRYYAVGEYGEEFFRPHYHAIIFGMSQFDEFIFQRCWKYGIVSLGAVEIKSIQYVSGYVQKKLYGDVADEVYGKRVRPFSIMSQGIGKDFCYVFSEQIQNERGFKYHGQNFTVPRYYLKKDRDVNTACKVASAVFLEDSVEKMTAMNDQELQEFLEETKRTARQRLNDWRAKQSFRRGKL